MYSKWRRGNNVSRVQNTETEIKIDPVVMKHGTKLQIPMHIEVNEAGVRIRKKCYQEFDDFFDTFYHKVFDTRTTIAERNMLFELTSEMIQQYAILLLCLMQEDGKAEYSSVINECTTYVKEKIACYETQKKRLAELKQNKLYVAPEDRVIDLKWKTKQLPSEEIPDHTLVQAVYPFVPLTKSIAARFSDAKFRDEYFDYNEHQKHKCEEGVFVDYCCGSLFKNTKLFQDYPNALQIELASDDFEVTSPLKSKATKHKLCAIYFRIRNLPPQTNSKLDAIHLVALCPSAYLKQDDRTFQDIADVIRNDLSILETTGVEISPGIYLKGTLVNIVGDNLGISTMLGFVECFVATYSCRNCECVKDELQTTFTEVPSKMRKKEDYHNLIQQLDEGRVANVKGIKKFCVLNKLKWFHMMENKSVDLMHDINEGVIPFFIKFFFSVMIDKKIANLDKIVQMVRDYNYGHLDKRNKPSIVKMLSKNLGQNASQVYCLMKNLPFIFWEYKSELCREWKAMEILLQIMTILYSNNIHENDVHRLEKLIQSHLHDLVVEFKLVLIFKHHQLTHYANYIRRSGPPKHGWMMRYEAFHKKFTSQAHNTNNFINIAKTLANRYQELYAKPLSFDNKISPSKRMKPFFRNKEVDRYLNHFHDCDIKTVSEIDFMHFGCFEYRKGLILLIDRSVYEILFVLCIQTNYLLLCTKYIVKKFDISRNSFQIEQPEVPFSILYNVKDLKSFQTYDKIFSEGQYFIMSETLDVYNACQSA